MDSPKKILPSFSNCLGKSVTKQSNEPLFLYPFFILHSSKIIFACFATADAESTNLMSFTYFLITGSNKG